MRMVRVAGAEPLFTHSRQPLSFRQAICFSLGAIAGFHIAYVPPQSSWAAFGVVAYVICLTQLVRLPSLRQAFYVALATGFACFAPQLAFFWGIFGPTAIALWMILALWIAGFVLLVRLACAQLGWYRAVFLTPFFWTGLEYFRSELYYLKFSWLNVGYAFAQSPLVPWRYLGVYGIGFIVAGVAAVLLIVRREHFRRLRRIHAAVAIGLAGVYLAMRFPGLPEPQGARTLLVAGVQLEFPEDEQVLRALDQVVATHRNAELIVLPEYTLSGAPVEALRTWCRTHQKFLLVGGKDQSPGTNYYNTAFVISTNGEIVFTQAKSVPIQFFADGLPATTQKVWHSPWGKIGICICYDLSYTRVTDELVKQGAQYLIVPTMDVAEWGRHQHELHARIAPVRAAEYGIPIFRVASSGISQAVTKSGAVQAWAPFPGAGEFVFFNTPLARSGAVPPDRLLALLSVGVTVIFLLRTAARVVWRRSAARE